MLRYHQQLRYHLLFHTHSCTWWYPSTAEQALIGYCKIIAEINRNKYVLRYRSEPRLTDNGAHDFKVRHPGHPWIIVFFL